LLDPGAGGLLPGRVEARADAIHGEPARRGIGHAPHDHDGRGRQAGWLQFRRAQQAG
jgi:hypothetical protein